MAKSSISFIESLFSVFNLMETFGPL